MEGLLPGELFGHESAEPSDGLTHIEAGHVDADCKRELFAGEIVGDKGEGRGDVEGLRDAHDGAEPVDLLEGCGVTQQKGYCGPYEQ